MSTSAAIRSVIDTWRDASSIHADRVALVDSSISWTYRDLDRRIRAWAARISSIDPGAENIALHLPHRAESVAALLGILTARRSLVALDPAQPVAQRLAMLDYAEARVVVGLEAHLVELREAGWDGLLLDPSMPGTEEDCPPFEIDPASRSELSFTSGSSGHPKAIAKSHRTLSYASENLQAMMEFRPGDRHAILAPLSVGATHPQVFAPLSAGATLCLFEARQHSISSLATWLRDENISTIQTVPSLFRALMHEASGTKPWPRLRALKLGGESAFAEDARLFAAVVREDATLINGLGLTEAGFNVCWFHLRTGDDLGGHLLPIGRPPAELEIIIERSRGVAAPPGEPGEVVVRSPMLASGYWRDDALTARTFSKVPGRDGWRELRTGDLGRRREDGLLEHLGRLDHLVKIRGHRVNPVEVEAALNGLDSTTAAAVVASRSKSGGHLLHAFVQTNSGSAASLADYRHSLAAALPAHMLPATLQVLDELPVLENGKIDRRMLSTLVDSPSPAAPVAADDALEQTLHGLFSQVLRKKSFSTTDSFFDLGGDSLGAATLFAALHKVIGREFPLADLQRHPSVASLAQHLRSTVDAPSDIEIALLTPSPEADASAFFVWPGAGSDVMALYDLARHLGSRIALYAIQHRGADGRPVYDLTVASAAARGLALVRRVQPLGPYALGGTSFGGLVALEVAREIRSSGGSVDFLALLDSYAPGYPRVRDHLGVRNRIALWNRSLRPVGRRDEPGFEGLRTGLRELRIRRRARRFVRRRDESATPVPLSKRFLFLQEACFLASDAYEPAPYDGEVHLFRVAELAPVDLFEFDDTLGWQPHLAGPCHIEVIPGRHSQHLREPNVRALASKLRARLLDNSSMPLSENAIEVAN